MDTITVSEAARIIQVSKPRIYCWLRSGELQLTDGFLNPNDVDYIRKLRNQPQAIGKIDSSELSDIFRLNSGTVRRVLNRLNIKPQMQFGKPLYERKATILALWNYLYRKDRDHLRDFSI